MKHIILFTIIIIIFIILGLIIINKLEMCSYNKQIKPTKLAEHFQNSNQTSSASSDIVAQQSSTTIDRSADITLYNFANITSSVTNFYERADSNVPELCSETSDCSQSGFICEQGECLRNTGTQAYELILDNQSYIELPVSGDHSVDNFRFKFEFILKNATIKKYLVSCQSNRWCMYNRNSDLFIAVLDRDGIEAEALKINTDPMLVINYGCIINTFETK